MTPTTEELRALQADAVEIAAERREKTTEQHMIAMALRNSGQAPQADGFQMAADYALRTARVLDATGDLLAEVIALREQKAALEYAIQEASDPDFLFGAMDNVHDAETTLDDYAAAASRAIRAALGADE